MNVKPDLMTHYRRQGDSQLALAKCLAELWKALIQEKARSDESEMACYRYDHTKGKSAKGTNILNAL